MNTQGIGLGLVISENIVKAFDGMIGVKSRYGKGTKFTFSIVLSKEEEVQNSMDIQLKAQRDFLPTSKTEAMIKIVKDD